MIVSGWRRMWEGCARFVKYLTGGIAVFLVKRRVKRQPADPGLWLVLARLYEVRGQIPQALAALQRARELDPNSTVLAEVGARLQKAHGTPRKTAEQKNS